MEGPKPSQTRSEPAATAPTRIETENIQSPVSPVRGRRRATTTVSPTGGTSAMRELFSDRASLRQRKSTATRRTGDPIPSLTRRTTLAERTQGNFTMAGPDETSQLHLTHQPFIQPGYTELNPSYEQPANTKPVWSLAKPLPRVVRPGMVPTMEELLQNRASPQLPAENSQRIGLDVDPNDLEKGQIPKAADPRKIAAQVTDARVQRETNFINTVLNGDTTSVGPSRVSRQSSRARRPSRWEASVGDLPPVEERESQKDHSESSESRTENVSVDSLHSMPPPLPDETGMEPHPEDDVKPGDEAAGVENIPALEEAAYPEDLHPLLQNLVEEEIHNNHTVWSVIRTHHREALAESLGVFVQLTLGFCGDLGVTLAAAGNPNTTDWVWGFATMAAIYVCGGISGAHLNPSITIMLWFYRGFPKRKMPEYFLAQFVGAFCAALAAYGVYYHSIRNYIDTGTGVEVNVVNSFVTSQRESFIGPATAFFNEFLGMVILSIIILALGDDQNAPPGGGMNSLIIGLVIACMSMCFAYQTGAAFNPSRDFGPRLALLALGYGRQLFTNPYWFYGPFAASLTGSFIGAFLYDFMIFTGGESPVNYPLDRTKRSLKKSRVKWSRRLHLTPREAKDKMVQ